MFLFILNKRILSNFHSYRYARNFIQSCSKRTWKFGHDIANIRNIIQRAKGEIDDTLRKEMNISITTYGILSFSFVLKINLSSNFHNCKKKYFHCFIALRKSAIISLL